LRAVLLVAAKAAQMAAVKADLTADWMAVYWVSPTAARMGGHLVAMKAGP
jgi:hypothetical protein